MLHEINHNEIVHQVHHSVQIEVVLIFCQDHRLVAFDL